MTLKFKNRIAYFNTMAVALITVIVFVVIYAVVHQTSYAHLDADILLEKEEVFASRDWHRDSIIINKMPEWDEAEHNKIEVNPTFLQLVDTKGKVIFHSSNLIRDHFLFNPKSEEEIFFNDTLSGQKIRLGQFPVKNVAGKVIGQLTIAISRQESYIILNNLILVLIIAFPLVLIVLFIASSIAASKAIEPVNQLIRTASGISDSTIGTRLTLPQRRDELFELTRTINDLLTRIESSMLQQKQFTSDASHEIRTPLAAIRGTLEVLIRKPREQKVYEEKIAGIIQQVDRLDYLLDQLLQLARIESGTTAAKRENISLRKAIDLLAEKWREAASEKQIALSIEVSEHVTVAGDRLYLELMLDNLVNNAFKYGRENGHIYLTWKPESNALTVKDDGHGISPEHLPNLFNRFYRADEARSSAVKGSGLGLSIVKKLADVQHITLSAQSTPGEGSEFTLTFPH
ncbi:MAG: HAMP domain-containing histidine kinase [Saprospiraceae bacterium]|nr:HAMP domain-containing histidine kinase [Candidatus Opimibacter iunctus]